MASAEHEPITGVWGQSPQRGPGAEPLVRRSGGRSPPEAESILVIGCPTQPANLAPVSENSMFCYGPLVSELGGGPECMVPPQPRHWGWGGTRQSIQALWTTERHLTLLTLPASSGERLCNGRVSVRPSVPSMYSKGGLRLLRCSSSGRYRQVAAGQQYE